MSKLISAETRGSIEKAAKQETLEMIGLTRRWRKDTAHPYKRASLPSMLKAKATGYEASAISLNRPQSVWKKGICSTKS